MNGAMAAAASQGELREEKMVTVEASYKSTDTIQNCITTVLRIFNAA